MTIFEIIGKGYIVLDAMDECHETVEVLEWVQSFTKLSILSPKGNTLKECLKISLNGEDAKVDEDITTYLEKEIKKCNFKGGLKTEVMNTLKEKAEGQFRWVDCQLKALASCGSAKIVRKALKDLPEDLEQTYIKAMKCTWESKNREDAHYVLLWLTYAFKPLTVRQVGDILAIDFERNCVDNANEMEVQINLIIDSTLVSVDMNSNVQLAHASVKDFMINQQNSAQTVGLFKINELLAHEKIGQACIIYLMQFTSVLNRSKWEEYPLFIYAAEFWTAHAKCVEDKHDQSVLQNMIMEFLKAEMPSFQNWIQAHQQGGWSHSWDYWKVENLLFYTAWAGFSTVKLLLEKGANPNAQGGHYGNALQAAVAEESEPIVKLLLEKGADPNAQGGFYGNALQIAVADENEPIVKLLLEKGADANAQGGDYGNAL
ncbi:ankyrin [Gymnopus androsaceus JB14]|uniref:Ankyrin n=1 Tax=Gymnopus androsaceus JB14 TaxID=1447944 RepID=A0A6A4GWW2_9AGAR|nr:ankyrin [Gymnopus androsaceus JB14]